MISQFYVLSPRGDTIINRDFRGDIVKGTAEIFFRQVKSISNDAPPIFVRDGITFMFLKRFGLYFVATTQQNISPAFALELLQQTIKIFKDFCGVLNEEAIRRNFVLIYEILDEIIDCGYAQHTTTERLKQCIHNDAVYVESLPGSQISSVRAITAAIPGGFTGVSQKTVPSNASHRPVGSVQTSSSLEGMAGAVSGVLALTSNTLGGKSTSHLRNKNEIFVDILERITVAMNSTGSVVNSSVDGCIQMKSYLAGRPSLRLALNEDVVIRNEDSGGRDLRCNRASQYGQSALKIEDCNFHDCVDLKDFETLRVMTITPPDGEFVVMNYRIADEFKVPFRIHPNLEQITPTRLELTIDLRADIPENHYGGNLVLTCSMPRTTVSVASEPLNKAIPQVSISKNDDLDDKEASSEYDAISQRPVGGQRCLAEKQNNVITTFPIHRVPCPSSDFSSERNWTNLSKFRNSDVSCV